MRSCELADFGRFDVIQMLQDVVFEYTHRESDRLNILYRKMLEADRLGRKNDKELYDYFYLIQTNYTIKKRRRK